jgi:hypothetical protein
MSIWQIAQIFEVKNVQTVQNIKLWSWATVQDQLKRKREGKNPLSTKYYFTIKKSKKFCPLGKNFFGCFISLTSSDFVGFKKSFFSAV